MTSRLTNFLDRLSLQTILTIPFVVQVVAVVGFVGYLSFKNGQATVNDLASQLRSELTGRILQQIQTIVEQPYVINQINANSLRQGDIDVSTGKGEHQLWQQAKVFPSTNLIYCSTEKDGTFLGVGHPKEGDRDVLQIQVANQSTNRYFHYYEPDAAGRRSFLIRKGSSTYDPRTRPWYKTAKSKREPAWSQVYLDFDTLLPAITASTPVYSSQNSQLIGVCATDIILSRELNTFLQNLEISKSGIAFILEPSGSLIASSTTEPVTFGSGEDTRMLAASESENPLILNVTQYLSGIHSGLENVESSQLNALLNDQREYLQIIRFNDQRGLDWIVVLVVPERDFMERIHQNTQTTFLLCVVALLVTIFVGLLIAQWLTRSLSQMSATARDIAMGKWSDPVVLNRSDAIGDLSQSFSVMSSQLRKSFSTLEKRIEERTIEIIQLNQELRGLANIDGLTQVANRRFFDCHLKQQWEQLRQKQQPLTLMLCDVDHFKQYNDTYGHLAGDHCLQKIAQTITQIVHRPSDVVARYGGEEFAIILSNTHVNKAVQIAQRINASLQEMAIPHDTSEGKSVTVSIGIATAIPNAESIPEALIGAADSALYTAKSKGRNCYSVVTDHPSRVTDHPSRKV